MNAIRTSLSRVPGEGMTWDEMAPMRREAWKRRILVVRVDDLADDWERQFAENIGNRLNGKV